VLARELAQNQEHYEIKLAMFAKSQNFEPNLAQTQKSSKILLKPCL
jgi:hypothetical protein